ASGTTKAFIATADFEIKIPLFQPRKSFPSWLPSLEGDPGL
ncbi:hypothetical protein TNIN_100841, partial [Trichonephila inaurata madagascariensis]